MTQQEQEEFDKLKEDRNYLHWRLTEIIPLFEEARDALPAIQLHSARLHNVSLSLADRMDEAGTKTIEDFRKTLKV